MIASAGPLGCASSPPDYPTRLEPPGETRRAPGVSLEPRFATPTLRSHDERTQMLSPPLDSSHALELVETFLRAVQRGDATTLDALLSPGAVQQLMSGRDFRNAREYWRRRLTRLNYGALPLTPLFRPGDVQIRRASDRPSFLGSASDGGYHPREEGEIALTVRPSATHADNVRLFGQELTFVIVEDGEQLVIARILEDFQLL